MGEYIWPYTAYCIVLSRRLISFSPQIKPQIGDHYFAEGNAGKKNRKKARFTPETENKSDIISTERDRGVPWLLRGLAILKNIKCRTRVRLFAADEKRGIVFPSRGGYDPVIVIFLMITTLTRVYGNEYDYFDARGCYWLDGINPEYLESPVLFLAGFRKNLAFNFDPGKCM